MTNPKLIKDNQRAVYKQQMKQDIEILELDAKFWEAKFKGLYYKSQYAELASSLERAQKDFEAQNPEKTENSFEEIKEFITENAPEMEIVNE